MTLELLQNYWWLLVSVLGAALVFLLFVQGGQSMLLSSTPEQRDSIISAMGSKWELTFTTLVTFGGAAFASFPLFYSTSFGGAYWLWVLILFSFILQAVSYEFRRKRGNVYGTHTYDVFLFINGCVGCVLLGVAVSMFFFGGEFTVSRGNIVDVSAPVISQWAPSHGLEAICDWRNLLLGFAVLFLARMQASLYMQNRVGTSEYREQMRSKVFANGLVFVVLFVSYLVVLLTSPGYTVISEGTRTVALTVTPYKYLANLLDMWWLAAVLGIGVVLVLAGWFMGWMPKGSNRGIWLSGLGTVFAVIVLFALAGYNDTAFYPSLLEPMSSLTIRNASASFTTLKVMSIVSILIPFVIAYIAYAWRALDKRS